MIALGSKIDYIVVERVVDHPINLLRDCVTSKTMCETNLIDERPS